jgi:hypothetical protein
VFTETGTPNPDIGFLPLYDFTSQIIREHAQPGSCWADYIEHYVKTTVLQPVRHVFQIIAEVVVLCVAAIAFLYFGILGKLRILCNRARNHFPAVTTRMASMASTEPMASMTTAANMARVTPAVDSNMIPLVELSSTTAASSLRRPESTSYQLT